MRNTTNVYRLPTVPEPHAVDPPLLEAPPSAVPSEIPRDKAIVPERPKTKRFSSLSRGRYKLEPIIRKRPDTKMLTYYPEHDPIDHHALAKVEKPTASGHNKGLYAPKPKRVTLDQLDKDSLLYKAWALDFAIGEAWAKGQDSFLIEEKADLVLPLKELRDSGYGGKTKKAFALAQKEDFFSMCASSMWGVEAEKDSQEFVDMLRGLIESWLPENRWHLELLATVADFQWKIRRIRLLQKNVFKNGPGGFTSAGLPASTVNASSLDEQLRSLQDHLERAIRAYKTSHAGYNK